MSQQQEKLIHQFASHEAVKSIDDWIAKYPPDQKQSAVMSALMIVQEENSYLTTAMMDAVAEYLEMPAIAVYEVASFYTMYEKKPIGRHAISVCTNISCKLRDADKVVDYLQQKLGIQLGETTDDGRFTLREVECLGACVYAPMMQIDKTYHENLTDAKIDSILEEYQ